MSDHLPSPRVGYTGPRSGLVVVVCFSFAASEWRCFLIVVLGPWQSLDLSWSLGEDCGHQETGIFLERGELELLSSSCVFGISW